MIRPWHILLEGASMLAELGDRALAEDLVEVAEVIIARSRELLERAALEATIELGLAPILQGVETDYYDRSKLALARLSGLEVRVRGLERYVETSRREASRCSVS